MNTLDICIFVFFLLPIGYLSYCCYQKFYLPYARVKQFRQIAKEITALYVDINPFKVSLDFRKNYSTLRDEELVYGEIEIITLLPFLEIMHPQNNDVFYDLGSGSGKALIATKLAYPTLTVKGIEVMAELHYLATDRWHALQQKYPARLASANIDFICANFLDQDFYDADIIFINATSFSPETWQKLVSKFNNLKKGCKILIISKQLPEALFKTLYTGSELMSWGFSTTRLYEKK
jgi:SAM-dependent methyltransferase